MNSDRPWFRSYIFPFWVVPVSWQGWAVQLVGVPLTAIPAYLSVAVFEEGSPAFIFSSAAFILSAGALATLAYVHTEKH
jgi:hypothetical protein